MKFVEIEGIRVILKTGTLARMAREANREWVMEELEALAALADRALEENFRDFEQAA